MNATTWRALASDWLPREGVPDHPDLGRRFPWRRLLRHTLSTGYQRRLAQSLDYLQEARERGLRWRVGISGGKDSTAMTMLLAESGWHPVGMSLKDDLDFPGETEYVQRLAARAGVDLEIVRPRVSLLDYLREERISLVRDLHSRSAELSKAHFYRLLDEHREAKGYEGVLLGLRARESLGRRMNARMRGRLYTRQYDALTVAQPLVHWTAEDVHAYLLSRQVPCLPVYLCIDPDQEPLSIRKSWWISGGMAAQHGHYVWLRRWWPDLWELAVEIDPEVAEIS